MYVLQRQRHKAASFFLFNLFHCLGDADLQKVCLFRLEDVSEFRVELDYCGVQVLYSPHVEQMLARQTKEAHALQVLEVELRRAHFLERAAGEHVIARDEQVQMELWTFHLVESAGALHSGARDDFANGLPSDVHYSVQPFDIYCIRSLVTHLLCGTGISWIKSPAGVCLKA